VARALRNIFLKLSKGKAKKFINGNPVNRITAAYAENTRFLRTKLGMVNANKNHVDHIRELWELLEVDLLLDKEANELEHMIRKFLFNSEFNLAQLEGNLNILKNQFLSFINKNKLKGDDIRAAFDILIPEHLQGSLIYYFRECIPKLKLLKNEIEKILLPPGPAYTHLPHDLERLKEYIRLLETLTGNGPFKYVGVGGEDTDEISKEFLDIANVSLIEELPTNEQTEESITYQEYSSYFNKLLEIRKELIENLEFELVKIKDILIESANMENAEIKLNTENLRLTAENERVNAASSTMNNLDGGFRKNKTLNRKKMVRKTRKLGGGPFNRAGMMIGKQLMTKAAQGALKSQPLAQTAFKMAPMAFSTQLGNPALRKFSTNSGAFKDAQGKSKESSWSYGSSNSENFPNFEEIEKKRTKEEQWNDMQNVNIDTIQSHETANFAREKMNKIFPPGRPKSINLIKKSKIATKSNKAPWKPLERALELQGALYGGTRRRRRHSKKYRTRKY